MRRSVLLVLVIILVTAGILGGLFYGFYNTGGNKLIKMIRFANTLPAPEKKALMDQFKYNSKTNEISGFYAFTYKGRIYAWSLQGLISYPTYGATQYHTFDICRLLSNSNVITSSQRVVSRQDRYDIVDFLKLVNKGDYLTIKNNFINRNNYIIFQIWAYTGDLYMNVPLRQECL